ncbi:MAG: MoaD/ThiS family protein [Planctomycetota bacterium]|nr:MoaD/ThiS family protein [Planctomycetota bacterium]
MKITVRLFAVARDLAGSQSVEVDLDENATVSDLRAALIAAFPAFSDIVDHMLFSVDSEYASDHTTITADSDIGCIPPVSGG